MTDKYVPCKYSQNEAAQALEVVVFELKCAAKLRSAGVRCRVLCRYYMHGSCRYGKDCQFSHDMGEMPSMVKITQTLAAVSCLVMSKSHLTAFHCIYRSANTTWLGIAHTETSADMIIRDLTGLKLPKRSSELSSCCSSPKLG